MSSTVRRSRSSARPWITGRPDTPPAPCTSTPGMSFSRPVVSGVVARRREILPESVTPDPGSDMLGGCTSKRRSARTRTCGNCTVSPWAWAVSPACPASCAQAGSASAPSAVASNAGTRATENLWPASPLRLAAFVLFIVIGRFLICPVMGGMRHPSGKDRKMPDRSGTFHPSAFSGRPQCLRDPAPTGPGRERADSCAGWHVHHRPVGRW